ncbi:cyclic lactone autoinducer peptide [Clostridium arbusti]|nr:cyclic lactone autoinducer peptide [Clostridium arbusti]
MKNKLKRTVKDVSKSLFKRVAFSTSASACYNSFYQPKEPKCLQKK